MPEISTQTETQFFARRPKNYFDCHPDYKQKHRNKIKQLLQHSDLKSFCEQIGLRIDEIKFSPNDLAFRLVPAKITIAALNISKELLVFKWMAAKDLINMSCRKYETLRKFLKDNYIGKLPCIDSVREQQIKIDNSFTLYQNDFGFFLCPQQKIKFVCEKFLERNKVFAESGIKKFKIRLCSDGVQISKKNLKCLNFGFTILDDERNCKSVFHTYILGMYEVKEF